MRETATDAFLDVSPFVLVFCINYKIFKIYTYVILFELVKTNLHVLSKY